MKQELDNLINSALYDTDACDKAYRLQRPKKTETPFVIYQELVTTQDQNIQFCDNMKSTTVQIDIYTKRVDEISEKIRKAILSLEGRHEGIIHTIFLDAEREVEEDGLIRTSIDIDVAFYIN